MIVVRRPQLSDQLAFDRLLENMPVDTPNFLHFYESGIPFQAYLQRLADLAIQSQLRSPDLVPATFVFAFSTDPTLAPIGTIVGRGSIRHRLNPELATYGGHLGYAVLPAYRNRGVATELLRQMLPLAHQLGISQALVTCDEDNGPSRRVIERNGGAFLRSVQVKGASAKRLYLLHTM